MFLRHIITVEMACIGDTLRTRCPASERLAHTFSDEHAEAGTVDKTGDDSLQKSTETQNLLRITWTYAEILQALHSVASVEDVWKGPNRCSQLIHALSMSKQARSGHL